MFLLLILLAVGGCSGGGNDDKQSAAATTDKGGEIKEVWEACFMDGINAGYIHTKVTPLTRKAERLVETRVTLKLIVLRSGQPTVTTATILQLSRPNGEFLSFLCKNSTGVETTGIVEDGQLILKTKSGNQTRRDKLPWDPKTGGCLADRRSLRSVMKPGEERTLKLINPILATVSTVHLKAIAYEKTKLLDDSQHTGKKLLKIVQETEIVTGNSSQPFRLQAYHWLDESGEVLKSYIPSIGQETYATTRSVAEARDSDEKFDLVRASIVKLKRQIDKPHTAKRIVYRVKLKHNDPAQVFATGLTQRVIKVHDNRTADIEVVAASLDQKPRTTGKVGPGDREPNPIVQSDDARVIQMARKVRADPNSVKVARQLEQLVNRSIRGDRRNYRQAFLTAAKVAKELEGDCTEHSVLLAALCRAHKIPARVVSGLVYSANSGGFAYHMWNEVWVNDRWYPMDATLGIGGIGAAHLKINDSNLSGTTPFGTILPVMQVFRQLELEVISVTH